MGCVFLRGRPILCELIVIGRVLRWLLFPGVSLVEDCARANGASAHMQKLADSETAYRSLITLKQLSFSRDIETPSDEERRKFIRSQPNSTVALEVPRVPPGWQGQN